MFGLLGGGVLWVPVLELVQNESSRKPDMVGPQKDTLANLPQGAPLPIPTGADGFPILTIHSVLNTPVGLSFFVFFQHPPLPQNKKITS